MTRSVLLDPVPLFYLLHRGERGGLTLRWGEPRPKISSTDSRRRIVQMARQTNQGPQDRTPGAEIPGRRCYASEKSRAQDPRGWDQGVAESRAEKGARPPFLFTLSLFRRGARHCRQTSLSSRNTRFFSSGSSASSMSAPSQEQHVRFFSLFSRRPRLRARPPVSLFDTDPI